MVVSDAELELLQGLPLGAQVLYLRELRARMDYATGTVGRTHRVSWDGMRQTLEVESRPGIAREMPSREQVRRLAQHLVRVGLVELISDMTGKQLIMRLPMAISDFCASKKADRNPTVTRPSEADRNPTLGEANNGAGFAGCGDGVADRNPTEPEMPIADTHPLSVDRDEMDTRAGGVAGGGAVPTDVGESATGGSADGVGVVFRRLLGEDGAPSAAVMKACGRVVAVCQQREVTALEMQAAIAETRRRGIGNVAGYAASIIESGSLVAVPDAKVVPMRPRGAPKSGGGLDAVFAAAGEAMGYE
ncbi:hypothetical protein [Pseudogulbenkiania ferrooxidans]|uniref:Uncharacterized protein n=1 Tax=Pseudogulbenkiania ferrooxidans 2002 TaxID=279714 RepID=B9YYT3_9NEIS|nr:hypothetical protein [Pseudogulbenkiania ferrooxidans]EEG10286.1 hypothetical protein FuraDRAFT_0268 [Pseudogulbenkiania ferrooxidans 2002]